MGQNLNKFPERVFIWSLIHREEDARKFCTNFQPQWLEQAEYAAIFQEIKSFLTKFNTVPSIKTLRIVFKERDEISYENRIKEYLDEVESYELDLSEVLWTLDKANEIAIIRSFKEVRDSILVQEEDQLEGKGILKAISSWLSQFDGTGEKKTLHIKDAVEDLIHQGGFGWSPVRIPTGISIIDEWTGGGLRPKQLGIILGVTGGGKSANLVIMSDKMARIEEKKVWLVTNELSWNELSERIACRLTGIPLNDIMNNPVLAAKGLQRQWKMNKLDERLFISDYFKPPITVNDLESDLLRLKNVNGFVPDVLVLDFMERMKPNNRQASRDQEWIWLQSIAQDLVSMAKKHNLVIWTACQTNRGGLSAEKLNLSHGQSSIRHFQEATAVVGIRQRKILGHAKGLVGIEYSNQKQRQSQKTEDTKVLIADLSRMNITNKEAKVIDLDTEDDDDSGTVNSPRGLTPRQKQVKGRKK